MKLNIYKRGHKGTYWIDQKIDARRLRQSLRTSDWKVAQHRAAELLREVIAQHNAPVTKQDFAQLPFCKAAEKYLESRKLELSPPTFKKEQQLLVFPLRQFGNLLVQHITLDDLLTYRTWRSKTGAGAAVINMEMGVLRRVLKRAKRWHLFEPDIRPLKEHHEFGRALTPTEKSRLLNTAASRTEWLVTKCAAVITLNTTMRGGELKNLRWADVNLTEHLITVRKSKSAAGLRVIPINAPALEAFSELYQRSHAFNGTDPSHYVFPACEHGDVDPTAPMRSWRTAWRRLTTAAGLAGVRFHDLRHHCITELAESQTSEQTILSIAGHVSRRMLQHYSHIRIEAKRRALDGLVAATAD
jgi:integrase